MSDVVARLAGLLVCDPPEDALEIMRLCLFDWAVCGLAARDEPVARAMHAHAQGAGPCTVFHGASHAARGAALANGTIGHALDFDDTHFAHIGHVSTVVFPAALAMAQVRGQGMGRMLEAALIGAEGATRLGLWLGRSHYQAGFHQTATAGAFGAALAASRLADAPPAPALRIVAGMAAGLKQQFGTPMKPLNAGMAAAHGVEAAQLAALGLDGDAGALEGAQGFGATHHGAHDLSGFAGIGQDWLFAQVTHKFHPCCHGTHAMLEALMTLLPVRDLRRVEVRTHPRWMSVCNKPLPGDPLEGKFSYRLLAALLIAAGQGPVSDAMLARAFPLAPGLQALMERVEVVADAEIAETATHLRVTDGAGTRVAQHDLTDAMALPLRRTKLDAKARALLDARLVEDLWQAIEKDDLPAFVALMGA